MTKKVLCIFVLLLAMVGVLASCKHEHTWEIVSKQEATCSSDGYTLMKCKECGAEDYADFVESTGCNLEDYVKTEPTCTSSGLVVKRCSRCNYEDWLAGEETIPALGHDWIDATCQTPQTCSVCKETTGSKKPHTLSNGSCEECGEKLSLNITMQQTPAKAKNIGSYKGNYIIEEYSVTQASYTVLSWNSDGTCEINLSISGEKTYETGPQYIISSVVVEIKDSKGNSKTESIYVGIIHTGEKFENKTKKIVLNADETYTLTFDDSSIWV